VPQAVHGAGVRFDAPVGWKVTTARTSVSATHDSQIVQVTTFPLVKRYDDSLFDKVKSELDLRMRAVAAQLRGPLGSSRTVTTGGIRSHTYDVTAGSDVLEYTFVLQGKREFELLCRRPSSASDDACKQLLATFAIG